MARCVNAKNAMIDVLTATEGRARADAVRAASVPTLVATGAHDLWPTEQYVAYARRIGAQVAVYETGHSPCETAPHQLVRDMLAMFAEVDGLPDPVDAGE